MTTNSPSAGVRFVLVGALVACAALTQAQEVVPEPVRLPPEVDDFGGSRASFQAAVEQALRQNPQVTIASEEVKRARALLEQVRAASLPTLNANGSYIRLDGNRILNGNIILGENQLTGNLTIATPLVAPKAWAQWSHAQGSVDVAATDADQARWQVALLAGRAYLTVLTQRRLVEVARVSRDASRAQYEFARSRLAGGIGTRVDEVRSAQQLATDEALLVNSLTGLRRAREALGVIVGAEAPLDAIDDPNLPGRGTLDDALRDIARRPDVRAATERRNLAHRVTRDSFTDYLPFLNGIFQPFYQDPPTLTVPKTGWQAQLLLTLPLFDGGLRYGQRRERSALEREAVAQLEGVVRQARADVRVAWESVQQTEEALAAARRAADLAKQALDLLNIAYRAGAATNLELVDAERQARNAAAEAALNEDSARQARLELLAATGRFPDAR